MRASITLPFITTLVDNNDRATVEYFTQPNVSITVNFVVGMPLLRGFMLGYVLEVVDQNITILWANCEKQTLVPCIDFAGMAISAVYEGCKPL